ncbi:MAG: 1-acyl-sn-glycerol-3-phosphate acyltransferase [Desulfonatronovibrio sp. MSAO_Bac4]|nr:MAG: 1-acyl-sn-glycerol-3-phosphate acyltransferase [Desulfonatronovibrio sp. MSAO_Bac4]
MRFIFKVLASIYLIIIFTIISLFTLIFFRDPRSRLDRISKNTAMFSPILLWIMGICIKIKDHEQDRFLGNKTLIVANHISYVDVFILAAIRPMLFISSVELSRKIFVGHVSKLGGTLFVERRKNTNLRQEIERITSVLRDGYVVTLFPEARTSDGKGVLPFKGALFEAAIKSETDVTPVCISYPSIDGQNLSLENKDVVVFHGGVKFFPHIINLFKYHNIEAEVEFFPRISTKGKRRKDVVVQSYELIEKSYMKKTQTA